MKDGLSRKDIQEIHRLKTRFETKCFRIFWRLTERNQPRVAFAFSRTLGKANVRNLAKRRLRAWVQAEFKNKGIDLFVIAKKPLSRLTNASWLLQQKELSKVCDQIHF